MCCVFECGRQKMTKNSVFTRDLNLCNLEKTWSRRWFEREGQ